MRTYKEPKRIDKARAREPGLVTMEEGISKVSALSAHVEEENWENSSDKDEEIVDDEDVDSIVQGNHIDAEANEDENVEIKTKEPKLIASTFDTGETSVKKKTPPTKLKKVIENNLEYINKDEGEKIKSELHTKPKKTMSVKEPQKRKLTNNKKEKEHVANNCVVDLGSKEKISPKSKNKSKPSKSKQKSHQSLDSDVEESEKSSLNTSDSLSISPRSSKRTPIKNRKYQSDDELELNKEETDSSGKKKRSRSKSPRCSTPKKRKLDFDESEFMDINDYDFVIKKDGDATVHDLSLKKPKQVVKSPKNKLFKKEDIILKPKAIKKKNKISQNDSNSLTDEIKETDKNDSSEKSKEANDDEVSELKEVSLQNKEKKKKVRKKKVVTKSETNDCTENGMSEHSKETLKTFNQIAEDLNTDEKNERDDKEKNTSENNEEGDNEKDSFNNEGGKSEKGDNEKGEKKEKRKMKPLEEVICSYCKKVSIGKAANTRHLKKCYVYQAKLEMQRQTSENDTKKDESTSEVKDTDKTTVYMDSTGNTDLNIESRDENESSFTKNEENHNEDKENLDNSLSKGNESSSSEGKSDNNLSSLKKKSKPDAIYNCQHCEYTANKRAMLARHLHSHSIYMCLRCSFFCESDDELKDHMHREHKERMDHKLCRKCSRYIHCVDITLEQHMENCQGPIPFKCPHCEKEFKYESSLKSHVVKHDPDGPKKFSCPQCSYKSNYKANLKKHLVNIHSSRIKQFKCTYEDCDKMFHSEDNMRRHLKWHKVDKLYKCRHCDKEFRTSGALSGHCAVHNTTKPFKCTIVDCEKAFRSQKLLKNHLQDFHNQAEKKFVCEHPGCDFAFFKRSHLDRHFVTHSGERKYGCSYCGKAFRHADNLRVHLRQHTNEKPVSCNMCDFKCRQKSSLRYHLQKVHNILFKKREKRKSETNSNTGVIKSEFDNNLKLVDSSMEIIMSVVNAVARNETETTPPHCDENNDKVEKTSEKILKVDSPVSNKVVDLYEFKSDDEFGDDSVLVPLPLPVQRPINHVTPSKSVEKVESKIVSKAKFVEKAESKVVTKAKTVEKVESKVVTKAKMVEKVESKGVTKAKTVEKVENKAVAKAKSVEKVESKDVAMDKDTKEEEQTDIEVNGSNELDDSLENTEQINTKPKVVHRGKKKKVNYAEPETDLSFEAVEVKEDIKEEVQEQKPIKRKRGPRKSKLKNETVAVETKEKDQENNDSEVIPKGRRGRKKVEKIPKKRGRKPKNSISEEKVTTSVVATSPPKKKKLGRPRKIQPPDEFEEEKTDENKEESDQEDDEDVNGSDKDDDQTIPGARNEEDEDTLDNVPLISTPNADDDDDTREYGDENLREIAHETANQEGKKKGKLESENEVIGDTKEEAPTENEGTVVEKQSENDSDKMSSGIDTDFEDDLKPPPAPRPPPVVDSDEGDIESGPDDMDTPGRDFESTPPKSNLTEHIHSVPAHTPRDFESSPPKSVQTLDYGPSTHSQTGFESRREGDSVEAMSGSYNATPSREVSVEEKQDDREVSISYSNLETENMPNTHSPIMEQIRPGSQSNGNAGYGSQSESTMPEVDKEYLGQYLQQFDSASRSEDDRIDRIERMNSQSEQVSEPIALQNSPQKDLPPLNLSANAPPLNLSTSSNDRENSQGSDMSNKRMEILSIDRQQEDHYSGRSESVSRSSDRIPDNVYESISSMNTFLPPSTREGTQIHSADSPFPSVSTPTTFMRFTENEALLQRQRMTTPFLPQGDPNALQNLHRMADNALAQHNNASLLRRPTTVPPREDMFSSTTAAMAQTMARNPFHNSWASQEVHPTHWSQNPYLGRSIDRPTAATSSSLFGKDNYLTGREFMFETSRRSVTDRNVFPGLPQTQRPEIAHETFPMERFDIGYFSGHTYPGATSLTDYNRAAAAHTSQKTFDERYRQSSTGITDFRALPQTTASSMFSSNMLNSSFHLDKYVYSRDPVYHTQHIPDATNSPFLPPGVPGQHSVFDREYPRSYFQNSPYSLDKQYAAAAAASAKLTHPSGASVVQDRDFVPRPGTAAATGENQVQDAYRHPMLYNMMNHRFYE